MPVTSEAAALTAVLESYRATWPVRNCDRSRVRSADELRDTSQHAQVSSLSVAPADPWAPGQPPSGGFGNGERKFLWVVCALNVPYAMEEGELGATITGRGKLSHTNLTGGGTAHCGGELWFDSASKLWLTGGSGRYPPRSAAELEAVERALRAAGYDVISAGWSEELGCPARFFRVANLS